MGFYVRHRSSGDRLMTAREQVTHQTVRLEAGGHPSPHQGMCVLELASVLAGDKFGAYPPSVCPIIATFLRCYNDELDDHRRQDLIPYAAVAVGSRASRPVERRRARACRRWVVEVAQPGFWHRPFWTLFARRRRDRNQAAAIYAALVALDGDYPGQRHSAALELISRLCGAVSGDPVPEADPPVATDTRPDYVAR